MDKRGEVCVRCGKETPETETNYTLISPKYGWRLSREKSTNGTYDVKWHCPECWKSLRAAGKPDAGP